MGGISVDKLCTITILKTQYCVNACITLLRQPIKVKSVKSILGNKLAHRGQKQDESKEKGFNSLINYNFRRVYRILLVYIF